MVDTNVLISLLVFSGKKMNQMMECIFMEHQLVLSYFEIRDVKGYPADQKGKPKRNRKSE